jgi:hypothetical protein
MGDCREGESHWSLTYPGDIGMRRGEHYLQRTSVLVNMVESGRLGKDQRTSPSPRSSNVLGVGEKSVLNGDHVLPSTKQKIPQFWTGYNVSNIAVIIHG